jgi:plasmid rolling circle replication initiator protein Rep
MKRGEFLMSFFNNDTTISEECQAKIKRIADRINYKEYLQYPITKVLEGTTWKASESDKLKRFMDCGKFLTIDPESGNIMKANFCKQRLCPVCNYIKSCVNWHKIKNCVEWIKSNEEDPKFIFMTLTVRNCTAENLTAAIDQIVQGFRRLTNRRTWKNAVTGAIRGLEITYNKEKDTYHPHIHILTAVQSDYFIEKSGKYITIAQLREWWTESARLDYFVQVDIEAINQTDNAIAEVAKYAIKMSDILKADTCDQLVSATQTIYRCTHGRRLIATLGNFKTAMRELNLSDMDELNLEGKISHNNAIDCIWSEKNDCFRIERN